ncbi:uncharacterized protein (TIGR02001 family) [Acinetobacter baylyi]|uniref:Uncharacterized protein (TIGR02001 family) n=1 Tax=Acinetobacter baylyi TaxID=202950 RepID=A0ABU0UT50_ACIBI|nr:TorF family putative porin [Acinetobacter baylyi]MDQ1207726.1 uncharacterized protein (TIGR02001 family) [Acinetobacter baylyi]MDR6105197.1 uncharacterized protein (TIGR02001 family) [Acinetobacter baylyi]MDR6184596.1 uncharacterized protein (TIGR02001 family) [Acinetobacter baylyi]
MKSRHNKTQYLNIVTALLSLMPLGSYAATNVLDKDQWNLSGNVTLASDYHWRGISLTQNQPAIQGGLRVTHQSGLYAGVWASNTDVLNGASIEADFMVGYRYAFSKATGVTLQYIDINYPGAKVNFETDFSEFSIALDHHSLFKYNDSIVTSLAFSPEYYAKTGHMWRFDARYDIPLNQDFGFMVAGGALKVEDKQAFFHVWGNDQKDHYYDWKAGITSNLFGLRSELFYADNSGINPNVSSMKSRVVFSVTKLF